MNPERWQRIDEILEAVSRLPVDQQAPFVRVACGEDFSLEQEIHSLLQSQREMQGFLESPAFEIAAPSLATASGPSPEKPPEAIGPYHLVELLGSGGMGEVWKAEQSEPLRRTVALKLVKAGMDTRAIVARFDSERQALALMDHPTIAKVFDAGETPAGRPYFVMEYVPGIPITEYCDLHHLSITERLSLFLQVCEGVQHAHRKAIIHRDLKPSNVLVEVVDDEPLPKIIDFGLAKAAGPRLSDASLYTEAGSVVGTPAYMSPEQADSNERLIDTRTDVYSLGIILYELLVGALPFGIEELRAGGIEAMLRKIREEEPQRPSTKASLLTNASSISAVKRREEPQSLVRRLKGELDWITLKAIEKARDHRYGSAAELAADIQRHLTNQPVLAGPPSAAYRASKFVRRHRLGVAVASAVALLVIAFTLAITVQARRISRERDHANQEAGTAEAVSNFMVELFRVSEPSEARGKTVTAREILDSASRRIDKDLAKDPVLRARLLAVMGNVYDNLGLASNAQPLLENALSLQNQKLGAEHPETLRSGNLLAQALFHQAKHQEAEALARQVYASSLRQLGRTHPDTLRSQGTLAVILEEEAKYTEAETLTRDLLQSAIATLGPDHLDTIRYRNNLVGLMNDHGSYEEATALATQNLQTARNSLGPDHPVTLNVMNALAVVLADAGHFADAEKIQRELLATQRRILGTEHVDTLRSADNLANFISDQERNSEAEKLYREILPIERRVLGSDHPETLRAMESLAISLFEQHRYSEAEALLREVLAIRRREYGKHPFTANAAYNLACALALQNRRNEAFSILHEAIEDGLPTKMVLHIEEDTDLKSLHGDPRFPAAVAAARKNAELSAK